MTLTPRQSEVLDAIRNYRHRTGIAPTMQELADILGVSKMTIFEHVGDLEKKCVIRRDRYKNRSIEIIGKSTALPVNLKFRIVGTIAKSGIEWKE